MRIKIIAAAAAALMLAGCGGPGNADTAAPASSNTAATDAPTADETGSTSSSVPPIAPPETQVVTIPNPDVIKGADAAKCPRAAHQAPDAVRLG